MSYRIDTFENANKAVDYLSDLYNGELGMSYPFKRPDISTCTLGNLRDYCRNLLGALRHKELYIDLITLDMFKVTYHLVWDVMEDKPGCEELPSENVNSIEEAYSVAKKAWSLISALGHDIEIVNPPSSGSNHTTTAKGVNDALIIPVDVRNKFNNGQLLKDYDKAVDMYLNDPENNISTDVSNAFNLTKRLDVIRYDLTGRVVPARDFNLPAFSENEPSVYRAKILNQIHIYLVEFRQALEEFAKEI